MKSDADNWIALLEASRDGDAERVRELLNLGTHPDSRDIFSGHTPLHNAIAANNIEIVNQLLDAGADVNHHNNNTGSTPLEYAVVTQRVEMVRSLISHGAILNPNGYSIIEIAREESTPEIVGILENHAQRG